MAEHRQIAEDRSDSITAFQERPQTRMLASRAAAALVLDQVLLTWIKDVRTCSGESQQNGCRSQRGGMDTQKKSWLRKLLQRIGAGIVADVPSELYACEVCRKNQCAQSDWVVCENRIAQAKLLEAIENKERS